LALPRLPGHQRLNKKPEEVQELRSKATAARTANGKGDGMNQVDFRQSERLLGVLMDIRDALQTIAKTQQDLLKAVQEHVEEMKKI
jgi:hypothetical protein